MDQLLQIYFPRFQRCLGWIIQVNTSARDVLGWIFYSILAAIKSYHGGIWICLEASINAGALNEDFSPHPYTSDEALDYLSDVDVLDDFPLPSLPAGTLPYLLYTPWEEFVKTMNSLEIPASIPTTWSPFDEDYPSVLPGRPKLLKDGL